MLTYKTGVYVWGCVLTLWLVFVLAALVTGECGAMALWYKALKDHDSLSAAITAVFGLIWSWFLQLDRRRAAARPHKAPNP